MYNFQSIRDELKAEKGQLIPIKCDLTKEEEILAMFKQIQKDLGGVDVCINNAGLSHCAPLLSGSTADWKNMLDVNFNFFKFSAPYFKALVHEYCNENIKICFL